jgi:SAM-dependent methyltransferase
MERDASRELARLSSRASAGLRHDGGSRVPVAFEGRRDIRSRAVRYPDLPGRIPSARQRKSMRLELSTATTAELYDRRFSAGERRRKDALWRVLCEYFFQRWVPADASLVDLGAGLCEFVNHIQAREKWALDMDPRVAGHAAPGIRTRSGPAHDLGWLATASVDVVFASNLFEHFISKDALIIALREVHRVLRPGGRILVLGPNIRYASRVYWDFFDHHLPLSDRSMAEALETCGFRIEHARARFLPYTTKSKLPPWPVLVRLYLRCRPLQLIFGKQMFLVAARP